MDDVLAMLGEINSCTGNLNARHVKLEQHRQKAKEMQQDYLRLLKQRVDGESEG